MENVMRHTAALPHGYRATFTWSETSGLTVAWKPSPPDIRSNRAWRKFRDAYNAARRAFMTDIATTLGGSVLIADIDGPMETIRPATKH